MEIIAFISVAAFAFMLGWIARERAAMMRIDKLLEEADEATELIMRVTIEKVDGSDTYIVNDKDNGHFITQVTCYEDMAEFFKKNHSDKTILIEKKYLEILPVRA